MVMSEANVESVEILMLESFPVQVRVVAKGSHPDPCTTVKDVTQKRDGNTFTVTITAQREQGVSCVQVIEPFEVSIPLDVAGLPAGTYIVIVNGISEQFTLDTDNVSP
jgi:inhibitor of cysteine peptidase